MDEQVINYNSGKIFISKVGLRAEINDDVKEFDLSSMQYAMYFIDNFDKRRKAINKKLKKKIDPINVFAESWGNRKKAKVTSFAEKAYSTKKYWVVFENNKREKISEYDIYKDCQENIDIEKKTEEAKKEIKRLNDSYVRPDLTITVLR